MVPLLRRALLASLGVVVAAATAAPAALPATRPEHVSIERAAASTTSSTGPHTFELYRHAAPTKPVQWLACRPIAYRINTASEPAGMTGVIRSVMASIGTQTGASFTYAGTTTHAFGSTTFDRATPTIYFSFTGKQDVAGQHFAWPGQIGVGGPAAAWYVTSSGSTFEAMTYGRVLLYTGFKGRRTGAGSTWQSLITHEVGHALDLDHRTSPSDAMYPSLSAASPGRFSAAEVTALKSVLRRTSCDYSAFKRL
ncbi:MAG TPA: matrixin family metalloprotease [Amnibacterium sp.]|nr:matrixin family metalloprotease [Amnibacterium sp.]